MWDSIVQYAQDWAPVLIVVSLCTIVVVGMHRFLRQRHDSKKNSNLGVVGPLVTLLLVGIALIITTLVLPIGDTAQGQLLGLLGLLTTAAVALSSTTFLGNAMAGIMLRAIHHFRPGDYVRVGEHMGRVSALGILHTEIQTEDRDLTTLPNLYLVTHPLTVLHSSGTVVSATVSLGYELSHVEIEAHLIAAAKQAGLTDPFVQVVELGDYSILYRAAGFLTETKQLLTTRSNLRKAMLDTLHEARIEIVSPRYINQRILTVKTPIVPEEIKVKTATVLQVPEELIFDKANAAEAKVKMEDELEAGKKRVVELENELDSCPFESEKPQLQDELDKINKRQEVLLECIDSEES